MSIKLKTVEANAQAAYATGKAACAQGIKCAPCLDKHFMENISWRTYKTDMKAWLAGWTAANLASN